MIGRAHEKPSRHEGNDHEVDDPSHDHENTGGFPHVGGGGVDVGTQARRDVQDHENNQTAKQTEENDKLIDDEFKMKPEDEDIPIGEKPGPLQTQLSPPYLAEKAEQIVEKYCSKITVNSSKTFEHLIGKAFLITPKHLEELLHDPEFKDNVGVLDLRNDRNWETDVYSQKIPGAYEFPINESQNLADANMLALGEGPGLPAFKPRTRQASWNTRLGQYPWNKLASKSLVVIHCRQSVNRTPMFAGGYARYVAGPRGQRVAILEGGFLAYQEVAKPENVEDRGPMPAHLAPLQIPRVA